MCTCVEAVWLAVEVNALACLSLLLSYNAAPGEAYHVLNQPRSSVEVMDPRTAVPRLTRARACLARPGDYGPFAGMSLVMCWGVVAGASSRAT